MKTSVRLLSLLLLLCVVVGSFASCDAIASLFGKKEKDPEHVHVDYVANTKLDMNSSTKKLEVDLKWHIDGDTTHFYVPTTVDTTGVMKARYLAVNTPESTGKIEEWGKKASAFTEEKITTAHSIIVESDDEDWNFDGNGRFLVWVWYQPTEGAEYRNLNLELLQNGLALGSSSSSTRYGEAAVAALNQANVEKLYLFSGEKDPQFPYGAAQSVTLKELRTNIDEYLGAKVAFEGVITFNSDYTAYVEEYDPETDMYYGIQLFYGYVAALIEPLAPGNRVRVVGTVGEFRGTYQVSSLNYNAMKPDDPANTTVISEGNTIAFRESNPTEFYSNVTIEKEEGSVSIPFNKIAVSTSISMKNLVVKSVYVTPTNGQMTLTCELDGKTISVRTAFAQDKLPTSPDTYFVGQTISVRGIIDYFDLNDTGNGTYQIKVYLLDDIDFV